MAETLHFSLVSPERELFSGEVSQVDAPGVEGEFGVLPRHAPFMTVLKPGVVRVYEDGMVIPIFVRGGFADVTPAGLTILAEEAIRISDVNVVDLDREIEVLRVSSKESTDETRRTVAVERLVYLERLRAAV